MSIGSTLAAARREAGLTIEEVSATTRIRQAIIADIEADDFSRSGGDFYARANIRAIAGAVGVDAAPLLAEYAQTRGGDPVPLVPEAFDSESDAKRAAERRAPNWTAAMAVALAVVLVYAGVQLVTSDDATRETIMMPTATASPAENEPVDAEPPAEEGPAPDPEPEPEPEPTETQIAEAPIEGVRLQISAPRGRSWVSISGADGSTKFEGELEQGAVQTFEDPELLRVVVGNAGAVDFQVNGQDVGAPGASGDVVRTEFGPEDPVAG